MAPRSARFRAPLTLALVFGLSLLGCDDSGTKNPGEGSGDPGAIAEPDGGAKVGGAEYTYAASGFKLMSTAKIKMELSTGQGQGTAEVSARSEIAASPEGDKLKVHGKVVELIGYEGSGQLDPEFMKKQAEEQGAEPMDLVAELQKSEAWSIVDFKGETDEEATEALAENQAEEGAPVNFGFFGLPDLPTVDLVEGEKVKLPTAEDEEQLPFGPVPVEVDVTWTLRGKDGDIAELDVFVESSGATEITGQGGSVMVSVLGETAYTIYFNTATQLPVSYNGYSASEISIDLPQGAQTIATNNEVETTFEVVQ